MEPVTADTIPAQMRTQLRNCVFISHADEVFDVWWGRGVIVENQDRYALWSDC